MKHRYPLYFIHDQVLINEENLLNSNNLNCFVLLNNPDVIRIIAQEYIPKGTKVKLLSVK